MKRSTIRHLCLAGVFSAIVFLFTAYLHVPSHTGYVHIGDGFIYLAACLLPFPYGTAVGVVGALLADCLTGFALWAPASVIIKAAATLCFTARTKRLICLRNLLALLPAWVLCVGGYYLYEVLLTGSFAAPVAAIPGNITQCLFSSAVFIALGIVLDQTRIKDRMLSGGSLS